VIQEIGDATRRNCQGTTLSYGIEEHIKGNRRAAEMQRDGESSGQITGATS
jgi:hypothetical protein